MRRFYFLLICLIFSIGMTAQENLSKEEKERRERNIQAANPFKRFGYKGKVATLSKGKYLEVHDLDSIVTIGSVRFHVDRKEIVGVVEVDTLLGDYSRPIGDLPSRWLSPDPLAEEFSSWSPYTFSLNDPIRFIDPDGRAADDWRNQKGQLVYDPKANGGKGDYTEHATRNERNLGNALRQTETGQQQFDKLVNSEQPIVVSFNNSPDVVKDQDGALQLGLTTNDYMEGTDLSGTVQDVSLSSSEIKLNMTSIGEAEKQLNSPASKTVYKGLNFFELLTVTFGHEIEHTTKTNILLTAQGGNTETKPTAVGEDIAREIKTNKK